MHPFPIFIKLNKRAILYGSVTCIAFWLVYTFILNDVANNTPINQHSYYSEIIGYVFAPLSLAISGYISGRIAGQNGFLHGSVIGLVAHLITMLGIVIVFDLATLIRNYDKTISFMGIILSGAGGAIGEIWPKRQGGTPSNN